MHPACAHEHAPPLAMLVLILVHPSAGWQGPAALARAYHPIQSLPFWCGFPMIAGFVVMMAALHRVALPALRGRTLVATMLTASFAALIFLNYITQTTWLPALVRDYRPENDALISAVAFDNPRSLSWAIEMWGYAVLGAGTWLAAHVSRGSRLERTTGVLFGLHRVGREGVLQVSGSEPLLTPPSLCSLRSLR